MTSSLSTNAILGYPEDAKLLIVNADDFGMCHASNEGTWEALQDGIVTSTTLMTPCPWAPHAMQILRDNPQIAFGVHLTVISEHPLYRWGPLAPKDKVPTLIDENGYFYANSRSEEFLAQANLDELELEYRTQIEMVLNAGLKPTHIDWHCLYNGGRPDVFERSIQIAKEYGLAIRTHKSRLEDFTLFTNLPASDHGALDSYSIPSPEKADRLASILKSLPAGLSEWALHPSIGDGEAQAMEPDGWDVRKSDYDFAMSQTARDLIDSEGIILLNYSALQKHWQA